MKQFVAVQAVIAAASSSPLWGDWPQFLGPARDGTTAEAILADFPGDEPKIVWSKSVGSGFAGPAVVGDTVYLFHRKGDEALLDALDANDGETRWTFRYPTDYRDSFGFDNGPRAVPLVAEEKVYLFGAEGMIHCVDAETGEKIWARDLRAEFKSDKGFFGRAPSPLIAGGVLIVQAGGEGCGILGIDPTDGEIKWKATDHEAGYASAVEAEIDGATRLLAFTREGFVCLDPETGKVWIEKRRRSTNNASVNAASPVVLPGGRVFLSACYDVGATVIAPRPAEGRVETLWDEGGRLDAHYATPVSTGTHLYGFHGRQETGTVLRCVRAEDGGIAWTSPRLPAGTVTLAGKTLVILTERGELVLAPATPKQFAPTARGQILGNGTRAFPALSGGHLFARDTETLVCVKLR